MLKFSWFPIERHVLVRGMASPDDPNLREYWAERQTAKARELPPKERQLAKDQNYVCRRCGMTLFNEEELHTHHLQPRSKGGKDERENTTLVHLYCHQQIHDSENDEGTTANASGKRNLDALIL